MLFSSSKLLVPLPDIFFNNNKLRWVNEIKYLGTIIDNRLSFNMQINKIENQISRGNGVIYRLNNFCSKDVLIKLYNTLIYSYISQNILIWGGASQNKLSSIQIVMNKTLRIILNVKFNENFVPSISTNDMYKQLKLLKLKDIYNYFSLKFIHSFLYGSKSETFYSHFYHLLPQHGYATRGIKMNFPRIRLEILKSLPVYNCVRLINSVPDDLVQPQTEQTLKRKAKEYFLDNY